MKIKATIIDHAQGSPAWLAHRARSLNASDLAAAMGLSKYKTRAQLIAEKATGIVPEVDADTQRRFDKGHEYEAAARPLAEEATGEALYPCVLAAEVEGLPLSASLDGMDLMQEITWEHKMASAALVASLEAGAIPEEYHPQMEQGLLLSGASRCLFSASKGDRETMRSVWYDSNPELRARIVPTWRQFMADVAAYVPEAAAAPAPVGKAPDALPALRIEVTGAVTASNLADFKQTALTAIRSVNRDLKTDTDFADAEKAVKWCSEVETRLKAAKEHALSQTADIDALFKALDDIGAEARAVRLDLDKLVKRRKDEVKEEAVMAARRALAQHIADLDAELAPVRLTTPAVDFSLAIKGLRSIASMQDALDTELANGKIAADAQARTIRANRAALEAAEAGHLFPDFAQVCTKPADDFANLISSRKAAAQERIEQERERIRAQEAARLEREQREESERQARELREAHDRAVAAEAAAKKAAEPAPAPAPAAAPAPEVRPFVYTAPAVAEVPTLSLGSINQRLGFTVSADFLLALGFTATKERAARLYRESDWPAICAGISAHVMAVAVAQREAA